MSSNVYVSVFHTKHHHSSWPPAVAAMTPLNPNGKVPGTKSEYSEWPYTDKTAPHNVNLSHSIQPNMADELCQQYDPMKTAQHAEASLS